METVKKYQDRTQERIRLGQAANLAQQVCIYKKLTESDETFKIQTKRYFKLLTELSEEVLNG